MTQPDNPSTGAVSTKKLAAITTSGVLASVILSAYALVGLLCFVPFLEFLVYMIAMAGSYLVLCVGIPAAFLVWATVMAVRLFVRKNRSRIIWTGIKYGIICFGLMGFIVGLYVLSGHGDFMRGFWLDMKSRANVEEIRAWGATHSPPAGANPALLGQGVFVEWEEWPPCIRRLHPGAVILSADSHTVYLGFGGGFFHWGMCVAPKGTPPGESGHTIPLEDGAWVVHETE